MAYKFNRLQNYTFSRKYTPKSQMDLETAMRNTNFMVFRITRIRSQHALFIILMFRMVKYLNQKGLF